MAKQTLSFTVDSETDKDVIRWLNRQGNRSAAIRAAIRSQIEGGVTLGTVYQAVKTLERKLEAGVVIHGTGDVVQEEWDEPPEAAAALDALADL
jgi:hypothetical protein